MADYGITGYRANWLVGEAAVTDGTDARLAALAGKRLRNAWLVWDRNEDAWFADAPVVLDFDGERLEVNHQKFDELSLTWNTADVTESIAWPCAEDSLFDLVWSNASDLWIGRWRAYLPGDRVTGLKQADVGASVGKARPCSP